MASAAFAAGYSMPFPANHHASVIAHATGPRMMFGGGDSKEGGGGFM